MKPNSAQQTLSPEKGNEIKSINEKEVIDYVLTRKAALVLRAINNKFRKNIINLLHENKKMTVTDIFVKMRVDQSVASQHLSALRQTGIVTTERVGKNIYYAINYPKIDKLKNIIEQMID
jgi:DNA-binding transcriptional ArsR family regulator